MPSRPACQRTRFEARTGFRIPARRLTEAGTRIVSFVAHSTLQVPVTRELRTETADRVGKRRFAQVNGEPRPVVSESGPSALSCTSTLPSREIATSGQPSALKSAETNPVPDAASTSSPIAGGEAPRLQLLKDGGGAVDAERRDIEVAVSVDVGDGGREIPARVAEAQGRLLEGAVADAGPDDQVRVAGDQVCTVAERVELPVAVDIGDGEAVRAARAGRGDDRIEGPVESAGQRDQLVVAEGVRRFDEQVVDGVLIEVGCGEGPPAVSDVPSVAGTAVSTGSSREPAFQRRSATESAPRTATSVSPSPSKSPVARSAK